MNPSSRKTPIGDRNVVLIGFMGTGKSTVGRLLAKRLGRRFLDSDKIVEKIAGKKVREIFAEAGEARFRELEREAIARLTDKRGSVISTGGGAVLSDENVRTLKSHGVLVCLQARPAFIDRRLARAQNRPLLPKTRAERLDSITALLDQRRARYAVAEFTIDVSDRTSAEVVGEILDRLGSRRTAQGS